ncbi:hypothetical protein D3C73_1369350 [compost metagenome]
MHNDIAGEDDIACMAVHTARNGICGCDIEYFDICAGHTGPAFCKGCNFMAWQQQSALFGDNFDIPGRCGGQNTAVYIVPGYTVAGKVLTGNDIAFPGIGNPEWTGGIRSLI